MFTHTHTDGQILISSTHQHTHTGIKFRKHVVAALLTTISEVRRAEHHRPFDIWVLVIIRSLGDAKRQAVSILSIYMCVCVYMYVHVLVIIRSLGDAKRQAVSILSIYVRVCVCVCTCSCGGMIVGGAKRQAVGILSVYVCVCVCVLCMYVRVLVII